MNRNERKREDDARPVGRIESTDALKNKFFGGFCPLQTHEDDEPADDEKEIDPCSSKPEVRFIARLIQGKVKKHNRNSS